MINTIIKTSFSSVKECFDPDNGTSIIIPNGFGINISKEIKEIKEITLNDFNDIKCPIFNTMYKEGYKLFNNNYKQSLNIQYFKLYEKYLYFSSIIYSYYLYNKNVIRNNQKECSTISYKGMDVEEEKEIPTIFFSMSSDSKEGLIANSLGMDKSSITKMVNFMIKYKFIELYSEQHSYIDYSKGETTLDKKCRHFIVSEQFFRSPKKYYLKSEKVIESLQKQIDKDLKEVLDNADNEEVFFEKTLLTDKLIRSYTFPTVERLQDVAEKMVNEKKKDKYGRIYSFGIPSEWMSEDNGKVITKKKANGETFTYTITGKIKIDCPYVDINIHIYNYILMMNGRKTLKKRKKHIDSNGNVYYDRFYMFLSGIPKWIRNEIKIDGEEIVEIDATALHPRILGKLYEEAKGEKRPEFLDGDSHNKIAEILNISREDAKLINLSYWNSKIIDDVTISSKKNKEMFSKMDEMIKTDYPKLFEYLKYIKCEMKPIKTNSRSSHTNMSVLLIDRENRIMNYLFNNFYGFNAIYVFDCIYVNKSNFDFANSSFNATLNRKLR